MGKKVLVSGGAGFIGSHIVDRLIKRADLDTLVVVDNFWTGKRENLAHLAGLAAVVHARAGAHHQGQPDGRAQLR